QVDFVDIHQLRVNARDGVRLGLIVVIDELDGPAEQAALRVNFLFPNLRAEQRLLAGPGQRARLSHTETDLDWFAALRERDARAHGRRNQSRTDAGIYMAPGDRLVHDFPP